MSLFKLFVGQSSQLLLSPAKALQQLTSQFRQCRVEFAFTTIYRNLAATVRLKDIGIEAIPHIVDDVESGPVYLMGYSLREFKTVT
ncbi:MAG: hypothetical protein R3C09_05785 [Pirellulaceae bacterium]